jgi:energy-coupling factor transporter ATP-binding protein EcfA2
VPTKVHLGWLGPNGAGKSTTMKILLDLASVDQGAAAIGRTRYRELADPVRTVGVLIGDHGGIDQSDDLDRPGSDALLLTEQSEVQDGSQRVGVKHGQVGCDP